MHQKKVFSFLNTSSFFNMFSPTKWYYEFSSCWLYYYSKLITSLPLNVKALCVHRIPSANEPCTMICPGNCSIFMFMYTNCCILKCLYHLKTLPLTDIHVVEAICLVAANVEKDIARNFAFARRSGVILLMLQYFFKKKKSISWLYEITLHCLAVIYIFFLKILICVFISQTYFCCQVCLCFANSVASTRFMLQDEFNLQTTKCDNCIIVISTLLLLPSTSLCL